jgi:hypothetical protein
MNQETLPNFFLIGAAKSGTTALYESLNQHPQVYLPYQKEPNFFCNEKNYLRGVNWYSSTFFRIAYKFPARGDASPQYLYWGEIASKRIEKLDNHKKDRFIVMFRDPVKRAYSHYWMLVHRELENLSFKNALEAEAKNLLKYHDELESIGSMRYGYYRGGQYATLLKPFLDRFPIENFHFILLEDMQDDFSEMMRKLTKFLEIRSDFAFRPVASNPAYTPKNRKLHHFLHYPSGSIYRVIRAVVRNAPLPFQYRLRRRIVDLNTKPSPNPPMDDSVEHQLRIRYASEIEQLERIIHRNLDQWKVRSG